MSQQGSFPAKPDGLTYPLGTGPTQTQFARRSGRLHKAAALIAFGDTAHRQGRAEVVSPRRHRNTPSSGLYVGLMGTAGLQIEEKEMLLASKAAWAGIVFIMLTTGISGPRPTARASGANLGKEVPAVGPRNDVKKMQETLQDKGHYRGKVDGVFGLRTRASIRAYQKAENLPVTGQLDTQTAGKLGVRPEGGEETGYETTKGKPSAGIKWAKGSGRTSKILRKPVKTVAAPESSRGDREKTLQAENDNRPQ